MREVIHGARSVHLIITMIKWIRPNKLSIKNSIARGGGRDLLSLDGLSNVQQFRAGLVLEAHRLLYHSTLGLNKKKVWTGLRRRKRPSQP